MEKLTERKEMLVRSFAWLLYSHDWLSVTSHSSVPASATSQRFQAFSPRVSTKTTERIPRLEILYPLLILKRQSFR